MSYLDTGRFDASRIRAENWEKANVVPFPTPMRSAERAYIENQIREHEAEIARRAQKIRWLRLELDSM